MLELGALVNAFGNGVVLPFLLIYLHNVRGISFGLAGLAAAVQSAAALASGFLGGTLSDRLGPKRVLLGALAVMTVAFALMPLIRTAWTRSRSTRSGGSAAAAFWPSQSALLAGLTPAARRAPAYALQRLAMNVGVALGGVTAGLIASVGHPAVVHRPVRDQLRDVRRLHARAHPRARARAARGAARRQLAGRPPRPGLHALHAPQRRVHDGCDLAHGGAPPRVREERRPTSASARSGSSSRSTRSAWCSSSSRS